MPALSTTDIPASAIYAARNDRQTFSAEELDQLARSIASDGLAQPPTVRPVRGRYEIVAGERRIRAMRDILGWSTIPCMVREMDDSTAARVMLAENLHRSDLDPIDEALAYQSRIERFGSTPAEVATIASVPVSRVRSRLELLKLAPEARHLVATKAMPIRCAALMVNLDSDRQLLAIQGFHAGADRFDTFGALCSRLQAEQDQESMFSADDFLRVEEYVQEAMESVDQIATLETMPADPVGAKDIAERFGVKAQTVAQWTLRTKQGHLDMPAPRWYASGMPLWDWRDVVAWQKGRKIAAK